MTYKEFEIWLRAALLTMFQPVAKYIATRKSKRSPFTSSDYDELMQLLEPGDILVTRTAHSITNFLIPGHYKHSIMYIKEGICAEATPPDVHETPLLDILLRVSEVVVLRPNFATVEQRVAATGVMLSLIGDAYDYKFNPDNKGFYCSEAIWHSYKEAVPTWDFVARERVGVQTVTPEDFFKASDFKHIYTH